MCGAPKTQEVVTRTELDPELRRHLYGGVFRPISEEPSSASPVGMGGGGGGGGDNGDSSFGGSSSGYTSFRDMFDGGGPGMAGPTFGGALGGISNAAGFSPAEARFGDGIDRGGMYAMGGMVQPQQGLASLNQGQMPMMNGGLPNLSDPMTAATLAMAMRGPQMQYGDIMAPQMPQQRFQDGGEVTPFQPSAYVDDRSFVGTPFQPSAYIADRDDGEASAQLEQVLGELPPQERQGLFAEAIERGIAPTPIRLLMLALARREDRKLQRQSERQGFAMGGMIEGPGTGTSDSIDAVIMQNGQPVQQALLSDGEFVMTERAVRGAGNGDREEGAAKMYRMMKEFERGGRV